MKGSRMIKTKTNKNNIGDKELDIKNKIVVIEGINNLFSDNKITIKELTPEHIDFSLKQLSELKSMVDRFDLSFNKRTQKMLLDYIQLLSTTYFRKDFRSFEAYFTDSCFILAMHIGVLTKFDIYISHVEGGLYKMNFKIPAKVM